jgi:hypothetical protein
VLPGKAEKTFFMHNDIPQSSAANTRLARLHVGSPLSMTDNMA